MADLKPIGSEKLPLDQKLQRIMEIANYGMKDKVDTHKTASLEYNIKAAALDIEEGDLLLFPAYLPHKVNENKSDKDRIVISFNVNINNFDNTN